MIHLLEDNARIMFLGCGGLFFNTGHNSQVNVSSGSTIVWLGFEYLATVSLFTQILQKVGYKNNNSQWSSTEG